MIPDLNDPATRLRVSEAAAELVAELPRHPGDAIAVLAILFVVRCAMLEIDPIELARDVQARYGTP